jgi:NitT/TauT family transport system permease protein
MNIRSDLKNIGLIACSLIGGLLLWQLIVIGFHIPAFILPAPYHVWLRLLESLSDGTLLRNAWVTLQEVMMGLSLGAGLAIMLGYSVAKSEMVEKVLSPYLVASQAIPVVALAPLLVLWFGPGIFSKVLVCAMTVFFPVLVNTVVGVRSVPTELRDLMSCMHAGRMQVIRHLEIPAALPILLGGFRIGATLAVIGAVVGEFVGSDQGLGFLVNISRGQYDTAMVFVAIAALIILALSLYGLVILLEKRLLRWQQ